MYIYSHLHRLLVSEEACGLCTERFDDTPYWPVHRTPCSHAFHYSCIQHILVGRSQAARKCPLCRTQLPRAEIVPEIDEISGGFSANDSLDPSLVGTLSPRMLSPRIGRR